MLMATNPQRDNSADSVARDVNDVEVGRHSTPAGSDVMAAELDDEEVDVWWGSYAGPKLIPGAVLYGSLTAVLFGLAWYFREWHGNVVRYWVQVAMALLWSVQIARWSYRLISTSYRLTTRRLLYYNGLF